MHRHRHSSDERRHARRPLGFGGRDFAGHGHHGGRGNRPERIFDHGDLRYALLHLITKRPRHGYELIKAIEEQFGGMYSPSPGVVYPTLTLLEELGYLSAETAAGTRRLYSITPEGTAFLEANKPLVEAILARMAEASRAFGGGPAPEIRRAMQNLEFALAIRIGRGPLDPDQVRAVAATLDRAAAEIEQS